MVITYDQQVIEQFAGQLYAKAREIVIVQTIGGLLIGIGLGLGAAAAYPRSLSGGMAAIVAAAIFGYIGYSSGQARAFQLRFNAQTALCQAAIEQNTRR